MTHGEVWRRKGTAHELKQHHLSNMVEAERPTNKQEVKAAAVNA